MSARSQQDINDIGFKALVNALGREDALRFVGYLRRVPARPEEQADATAAGEPLPVMTPEELHQRIMDMREPDDQASFL